MDHRRRGVRRGLHVHLSIGAYTGWLTIPLSRVPERKKDPVDRALEWIFPWGSSYKKAIYSKEQSKVRLETYQSV